MAKLLRPGLGPKPPIDPPVLPPVIPPDPPTATLKVPAGKVRTKHPDGHSMGTWENAASHEPLFTQAQRPTVPADLLMAISLIESDSNHVWPDGPNKGNVVTNDDRFGDGPAVGIMQVKPKLWQSISPKDNLYDKKGNIFLAAKLMEAFIKEVGSWERAIREKYHPGTSAGGVTPQSYVDAIKALRAEIASASKPIIINPPAPVDPLVALFGPNVKPRIEFGFLDRGGVGYLYAVGHGTTNETEHPGDDILVPYGTKFYSPGHGKVLCVGEQGQGVWGQACGYYADTGNAGPGGTKLGVGNITVLFDTGHKVVFGHSRTCNFRPGDRVEPGDFLGTVGGMLGAHMHLEVAINKNGTFWVVNPLPAIRIIMGQTGAPVVTPVSPITNIIWEGTTNFHDRQGQTPVAIFFHMTDDMSFSNVKSWFQNPRSKASSHFVIDRGGQKHQFVGSAKSAWTNGDIKSPRTDIRWINEAIRSGRNFNDFTLNLEFISDQGKGFTSEQIDSGIEIAKYYVATYRIPLNRGHLCRHADVNTVDRSGCPGNEFPMAEVIQEIGGDPLILNP